MAWRPKECLLLDLLMNLDEYILSGMVHNNLKWLKVGTFVPLSLKSLNFLYWCILAAALQQRRIVLSHIRMATAYKCKLFKRDSIAKSMFWTYIKVCIIWSQKTKAELFCLHTTTKTNFVYFTNVLLIFKQKCLQHAPQKMIGRNTPATPTSLQKCSNVLRNSPQVNLISSSSYATAAILYTGCSMYVWIYLSTKALQIHYCKTNL